MDENRLKRSEEQLLLELSRPSAAAAAVTSAQIHSSESQNAPAWKS